MLCFYFTLFPYNFWRQNVKKLKTQIIKTIFFSSEIILRWVFPRFYVKCVALVIKSSPKRQQPLDWLFVKYIVNSDNQKCLWQDIFWSRLTAGRIDDNTEGAVLTEEYSFSEILSQKFSTTWNICIKFIYLIFRIKTKLPP